MQANRVEPNLRRVGLLGGSFDPIHPGHIALGRSAAIALGLDEVRLIPTARSWQKASVHASAEQRLAMLKLALENESLGPETTPQWHIDPQEVQRGPPTYTIDTLRALRQENSQAMLCLILGSDQFARLHTWHRYQELLNDCHIAVTTRLPILLHQLSGPAEQMMQEFGASALPNQPAGKITQFRMQAIHLSSTQIRALLAGTESSKPEADKSGPQRKLGLELLHPLVAQYVEQHSLYLSTTSPSTT